MSDNNKKMILTAVALCFFLTPVSCAFAVETPFTLKYEFPCQNLPGTECYSSEEIASNPAAYIARLYQFALAAAVMLSLGMLIFGGIQYIISRGRPAEQTDANDRIVQALWGLVLLFGAYLILYTIDPSLTNLKLPVTQQTAPTTGQGAPCNINEDCLDGYFCNTTKIPKICVAATASLPTGVRFWLQKGVTTPNFCKIVDDNLCPTGKKEGERCCEVI